MDFHFFMKVGTRVVLNKLVCQFGNNSGVLHKAILQIAQ